MIDIDWFLKQSTDLIRKVDDIFNDDEIKIENVEMDIRLHLFAAWANWRNILLMDKAKMVELTREQRDEFNYINLKFVQYKNWLPKETSSLSI